MKNTINENSNLSEAENKISFRSEMSGGISGFYWLTIILLAILAGAIVIFAPLNSMEKILLLNLFTCITLVLLYLLTRASRTSYTINSHDIKVYGAMGTKNISYNEIESIKKSPIPSGLRLFGFSFLGGWYYLPGIGRTWVSMTNFKDGVLISTKDDKKFMITPKDPMRFIKVVNKRIPG
jgi:hypothetical protein